MRLIRLMFCIALLVGSISQIAHAEDSAIKQKLTELESIIGKELPSSFNNEIEGKLLLIKNLKQTVSFLEDNKLTAANNMIRRIIMETENRFTITNPVFKEDILRRLSDISASISKD
jgi:hypothetical protein